MARFLFRRLLTMIATALCLTFIVFALTNLPPNLEKIAKSQAGSRISDAEVVSWLEKNGYAQPLLRRYGEWLGAVPGAHAGIALATGLAGLANAWLLWRALCHDTRFQLGAGWGRHLLRIGVASLALAAAVLGADHAIGDWRAWSGEWRWLLMLGVVAAGAAAYGLGLLASGWRPRELRGP